MPQVGKGTVVRLWNGASWEQIAEVKSIGGIGGSRNTIDTTTLDTEDYRTFIGGLRDNGELSLTLNWSRSVDSTFRTSFESDANDEWEVVLPDDDVTSFQFEGTITNLSMNIPIDDLITMDVTIKISGGISISSGSYSGTPA
jgi:predicted secreted protein